MAGVRGREVRIALGSVGPTVVLARNAAAVLAERDSVAEAQVALREEIAPQDDIRSTASYRWQVAENMLAEFWQETE